MCGSGLEHYALFYGDAPDYAAALREFADDGLAAGEPVLAALPASNLVRLRNALGSRADRVQFLDMEELGRNPGRIIPRVRSWVEQQRATRCRFIGEPIWPERSHAEAAEATRHEALINLAFVDADVTILCPYDRARLESHVIDDALRTHPSILDGRDPSLSWDYQDPSKFWRRARWEGSEPPPLASWFAVGADLSDARGFVAEQAGRLGVSGPRREDLVLCVNEAVTNAVRYGRQPVMVWIWREGASAVCEVADGGQLTDPLVGRREPDAEALGGRGLWLINQLCDLVELWPTPRGTRVRMRLSVQEPAYASSSTRP